MTAQAPATPPEPSATSTAAAEIRFHVEFAKFAGPSNQYAPYYAWDAKLGFDVDVISRGRHALAVLGVMQSAGTENFGSRIGVGGAGYLIHLVYRREHSATTRLRAGIAHLSSHLTRDLDEKTADQRRRGVPIPAVADPAEYNMLFVEATRQFPGGRFGPNVRLGLSPLNVRLDGRVRGTSRRPLYASTWWKLRRVLEGDLVLETEHEIGENAFSRLTFAWDRETSVGGKIRFFVSVAPGRGLHVSPHVGAVRDGVSLGVRLTSSD